MSWPNFVPPENHIVISLLDRLCGGTDAQQPRPSVDDRIPDAFSDAFYTVKNAPSTNDDPGQQQQPPPDNNNNNNSILSVTYTLWEGFERVAGDGVLEAAGASLEASCQGVVRRLLVPPRSQEGCRRSCDLSFEVDLEALSGHAQRRDISKRIASLYLLVAGLPLRRVLERAAAGESGSRASESSAGPRAVAADAGLAFFVKEGHGGPDSVAVMFPIREMKLRQDVVLLVLLVQEFAAVSRTSKAMAGAPNCYFSSAKQPPPELDGADPELLGDPASVHGYLTFVLSRRHLEGSGGRLDAALWAMLSFYAAATYQMKSFKVAMHSKMRGKVGSMMQVLKSTSGRTVLDDAFAARQQQQQQQKEPE